MIGGLLRWLWDWTSAGATPRSLGTVTVSRAIVSPVTVSKASYAVTVSKQTYSVEVS